MPRNTAIKVFFSCSDSLEDESLRQELEKHLGILERTGVIKSWNKRMISAGKEWKGQIDEHLKSARIILLLISPDFISSDYCWDLEVKQAMKQHNARRARVIPILLRPVSGWEDTPFGQLLAFPRGNKPVTLWSNRDEAFSTISEDLRKVVDEITEEIAAVEQRRRVTEELKKVAEERKKKRQLVGKVVAGFVVLVSVIGTIKLGVNSITQQSQLLVETPQSDQTPISIRGVEPDGWIWIGALSNVSGNFSVGEELIPGESESQPVTVEPGVVPSEGDVVTLTTGANLRTNEPQITDSKKKLAAILEELPSGQKLIILRVKAFPYDSYSGVWAEVARCNRNCEKR